MRADTGWVLLGQSSCSMKNLWVEGRIMISLLGVGWGESDSRHPMCQSRPRTSLGTALTEVISLRCYLSKSFGKTRSEKVRNQNQTGVTACGLMGKKPLPSPFSQARPIPSEGPGERGGLESLETFCSQSWFQPRGCETRTQGIMVQGRRMACRAGTGIE